MIVSEEVFVIVNGRNCKYYEGLGYDIPKYIDCCFRKSIKRGTKIKVKVTDLMPKSKSLVLRKCDCCGEVSEVSFYQYRDVCSKCSSSGKMNKRWRNGVSKSKNFCVDCGKEISWNSVRCLKCFQKGHNNSNFNENLSNEERLRYRSISGYKNWKKRVHIKDDFVCQKCGAKDNLNAHHIVNFYENKEIRTNVDNGITLCCECHKKFHKLFGKKNNNMRQINEFLGD